MKNPYMTDFSYTGFVLRTSLLCAKNMRKNGDYYEKKYSYEGWRLCFGGSDGSHDDSVQYKDQSGLWL